MSKQIKKLKERLADLKEGRQAANSDHIERLEEDLTKAYEQEERYWREKSRVKWLKWGDQNTKFFHARFHDRNKQNKIWKLEDGKGGWCSNPESIGKKSH